MPTIEAWRTVEPFEATRLPPMPVDNVRDAALGDVLTAISGFPHAGYHADAVSLTVRWLTANPEWLPRLFPDQPTSTQ